MTGKIDFLLDLHHGGAQLYAETAAALCYLPDNRGRARISSSDHGTTLYIAPDESSSYAEDDEVLAALLRDIGRSGLRVRRMSYPAAARRLQDRPRTPTGQRRSA